MGRLVKITLWIAGFFAVFTLVGFFVLPPVLKSILVKKLSENIHRPVSIKEIKINPYLLTVTVRGFAVKERGTPDPFVSFDEIFVRMDPLSVTKRALILKEIRISKPYLRVIRHADESYNFSDLMKKVETDTSRPSQKSKPIHFSLNNIAVSMGSIDFYDGPKETWHSVRDMNIGVPFVSDIPHFVDTFIQPAFSASINGNVYSISGKVKPFADSHESYVDFAMKGLDLVRYLPYVPVKLNCLLLSGTMDLDGKITFIQYRDKGPSLQIAGNILIENIAIDDKARKELVRLPSMNIVITSLEPLAKTAHLARIGIESPSLVVQRDKEGRINLQSLVAPETTTGKGAEPPKARAKPDEGRPFLVAIDGLEIQEGRVVFQDLIPPEPVTMNLTKIALQCDNISTEKNSKATMSLSFLLNKGGRILMKGPVGIDPLSAALVLDVKGITIGNLQPYFTDKVKIAVTGGELSMAGKVTVSDSQAKGLSATYGGKLLISNLSSVDKAQGEDFLKWKAFSLTNVNAGYNPLYAKIDGISLTDFYARIIVNPDGSLNVQHVLKDEQRPEATTQAPATGGTAPQGTKDVSPGPDIQIGNVTLQGGTIDFSDRLITPSYSASLTEIGGRVSSLSLKPGTRAEVEVRGKLDNSVPLEITGKINPSTEDLFADLAVKFRDLDLSAMTPYSGKYVGYTIQKGKLSLDLKYLIQKRKLDSTNVIFFDQFSLGDRVESPAATKLPVRLAIALLKDRRGQIKLDIPVSGSLDDPKFSIGKIILQIIVNLIAKAATSPFALLGALFGGGEELSYAEFDYGNSRLAGDNLKKIEKLVSALYDRPSLQMDIGGHVDVERDREALKQIFFARKLKARKLEDLIKKGQPAGPVDDIKIESQEYAKYLAMAYKTEKFAKPKNIIGMAKSLPPAEMEKLIMTNTVVKDEDLRALAGQRAMNLKELILKSGKVTADRVFITEPKSLAPEKKKDLKDSRADFKLK